MTFVCLTMTFLICHMPRLIINVNEVPESERKDLCQNYFKMTYYSPRYAFILCLNTLMQVVLIQFSDGR